MTLEIPRTPAILDLIALEERGSEVDPTVPWHGLLFQTPSESNMTPPTKQGLQILWKRPSTLTPVGSPT